MNVFKCFLIEVFSSYSIRIICTLIKIQENCIWLLSALTMLLLSPHPPASLFYPMYALICVFMLCLRFMMTGSSDLFATADLILFLICSHSSILPDLRWILSAVSACTLDKMVNTGFRSGVEIDWLELRPLKIKIKKVPQWQFSSIAALGLDSWKVVLY